jgi:transcription antitermination factor NusA-like protein
METTKAQVNVNHPIGDLEFRPVTVKGTSIDIIFAGIKLIMETVDEMMPNVRNSKKRGANIEDLEHNSVSAKFVLPEKMLSFIISKNGNFLRALSQKFGVRINIDSGKSVPCLGDSTEGVCQIKGKLSKVQYTTVFI